MAKDDIKNLFTDSKKELDKNHQDFKKAIKDDLQSFKKKALEKI